MKYLKSKISNAGKAWFQLILNGEIAQNANGQKSSTKQESSGGAVLECLLTMTEVLGSIPGEALTLIFCLDVELFFLSFFLSVFPEQLLQSTPPFFSPHWWRWALSRHFSPPPITYKERGEITFSLLHRHKHSYKYRCKFIFLYSFVVIHYGSYQANRSQVYRRKGSS